MIKPLLSAAALCAVAAVSLPVQAEEESLGDRFVVDFRFDDEGKATPETYIPIDWSEHYYSGLGYSNRTYQEAGPVEGFANSKNGTFVDERRVRLDLINYERGDEHLKTSFGAEVEMITIDKQEFGYVESGSTLLVFDNNIGIDVVKPGLKADVTWKSQQKDLNLRTGVILSPASTLSVEQDTTIKPLVADTGSSDSSKSQDMAYSLNVDLLKRFNGPVDIGLTLSYEMLPLTYDLAILNTTNDGFTTTEVAVEEETLRYGLRFVLKKKLMGSINPVIGYMRETITTTDTNTNEESETENDLIILGVEKKF